MWIFFEKKVVVLFSFYSLFVIFVSDKRINPIKMTQNKPITLTVTIPPEQFEPFYDKIKEILTEYTPKKEETTYLTVKEAAKLANRSAYTIARHIREGKLVASKQGKEYRISNNNFENYING